MVFRRRSDPAEIARQLRGVTYVPGREVAFDNLYEVMFVRPVLVVSRWFAEFDRR